VKNACQWAAWASVGRVFARSLGGPGVGEHAVYTPDDTPVDWAMAEYNLGVALHSQAAMAIAPDDTQLEFLTQAEAG